MKDNKFIAQPFVPKTETRIILENKQSTRLTKLATFLGISTVYNCGDKPCACNVTNLLSSSNNSSSVVKPSQSNTVVAVKEVVDKAASQYGGNSSVKTNSDGSVSVTYTPKK